MIEQTLRADWSRPYRVVQWATGNVGSRAMRRVIEHPGEVGALQGKHTELRQQLLLANAQTECATGQVVRLTVTGLAFNNRLFRHRLDS